MENLIVTRVSDLGKLRASSDIYHQEKKDYNSEGEAFESFTKDSIVIGTKQNLTPHWDRLKNEYSFFGGIKALIPIAEKLSLRDPKDKSNGSVIMPNEHSFKNMFDPFFCHPDLYKSVFVEETSKVLTENNPLEEFYMRVLKGRQDIEDSSKENQSTLISGRGKLQIHSPKDEQVKKAKTIEEEAEAWELFISLKSNFEKLKRMVAIADPPSFNESYNDQQAMQALVRDEFITNDSQVTRYGTTARKYFIHLCKMSNEDLEVTTKVMAASRAQIIRRNTSEGYTFQGEKLNEGTIKNDKQLVEFFKNDANMGLYRRMEILLDEKENLTRGNVPREVEDDTKTVKGKK